MNQHSLKGIDRHGLDANFEAEETLKSNLILEGQLLAAQMQPDAAADRFAQAAEIDERLSDICLGKGLREKSWVHLFSAASCWAQAGNFHEAICLGDQLLAQAELPSRLRQRAAEFTGVLRQRRIQWAAGLAPTAIGGER
jgi:hypothetical protein